MALAVKQTSSVARRCITTKQHCFVPIQPLACSTRISCLHSHAGSAAGQLRLRPQIECRVAQEEATTTTTEASQLVGEDAASFDLGKQSLTSWGLFTVLLSTVLGALYLVWIQPGAGLADDYLALLEGWTNSNPEVTMLAILGIFAVAHSGLAGLRPKGEEVIGARAYRVIFALVSLPLAVVAIVYFINHRYDGTPLWNVQSVPGVHELVWALNFISFYFLYPSTFNLLEVAAVDKPKLHMWETGIMRISRHPQMVGQGLWCAAHTLWVGNSFMLAASAGLMAHHLFGCWHGDRRLSAKYGEAFEKVKARTSIVPFQAVWEGRQVLLPDYWKEFMRLPYAAVTAFTLGAYFCHPLMQQASYSLHWAAYTEHQDDAAQKLLPSVASEPQGVGQVELSQPDLSSVITQVTSKWEPQPQPKTSLGIQGQGAGPAGQRAQQDQNSWGAKVKLQVKLLLCCFTPSTGYSNGGLSSQASGNSRCLAYPPVPPTLVRPTQPLIGPKDVQDSKKKTLVLDLDETLVHSSFKPIPAPDYVLPVEIDGKLVDVYVLKRPWLDHFMEAVGQRYEVVVFTASLAKYADPLLDLLDKTKVVRWRLFRESCVPYEGNYVKDLATLGRKLEDIIIVDNSPHSYALQPENALPIGTFIDDMEDQQLLELLPVLQQTEAAADVRGVLAQYVRPDQRSF